MEPEDAAASPGPSRPVPTLAAAKAALREWQAHMRRGARLPSEEEYAEALGLAPLLPNPPAYLARTLRALADLCASQGRLEDAASIFARVAEGRGRKSEVFWRDYAGLLFKLALKRVAEGRVALANEALAKAAELLRGPADLPDAWKAAWEGYAETALWFERAGDALPAGLHAEHALAFAARLSAWDEACAFLRGLAQAGRKRLGAQGALPWLRRLKALADEGRPGALDAAVQSAVAQAQAELAVGRPQGAAAIFSEAETWLRAGPGPQKPALADLHLAWGLALGPREGRPHLEEAYALRLRLLGPLHPRTHEAEQALRGLDTQAPAPSDGRPRDWDGGARFTESPPESPADGVFFEPFAPGPAASEVKRLHHRLARLCHPDAAPEEQQAWRHELMVRVNHAAENGDLFSLRALLREVLARSASETVAPSGPMVSGFQEFP